MAIATTTTLSITAIASTLGATPTLNASVSAATGPSPNIGTVAFKDGNTTLGSMPVDSGGNASLDTPPLARGGHSFTAAYTGGDGSWKSSTSDPTIFFVSAGLNVGRVILNQLTPVQVFGVRPGRTYCEVRSGAALVAADFNTVTTVGIVIASQGTPLQLTNYDGELWAMCPGPAHGFPKGFGVAPSTLSFIEVFG